MDGENTPRCASRDWRTTRDAREGSQPCPYATMRPLCLSLPHRRRRRAPEHCLPGLSRPARSAPVHRAQRPARDRARRDSARHCDRRGRVARRSCRRREVRHDDHGRSHDRDPAAARVQPRGHPLHALHRRADLYGVHAARAGTHLVGGRVHRAHADAARLAGARAHIGSCRVQHGCRSAPRERSGRCRARAVARDRSHPARRAATHVRRDCGAHARVPLMGHAGVHLHLPHHRERAVRAAARLVAHADGFLHIHCRTRPSTGACSARWPPRRGLGASAT